MSAKPKTEETKEDVALSDAELRTMHAELLGLAQTINTTKTKQDDEMHSKGWSSDKLGQQMGELSNKYNALIAGILGRQKVLEDANTALRSKYDALESLHAKRAPVDAPQEFQTLGKRFVESKAYKDFRAKRDGLGGGPDRSESATVGALWPRKAAAGQALWGFKDLIGGSGTGDGLVVPYYDRNIVNIIERMPVVRDLLQVIPISSDSVKFVQQSQRFFLFSYLTAQASSGQADIVLNSVAGMYAGQTLVITDGTNTDTKVIDSIATATKTVTLTTNLANTYAAYDPIAQTGSQATSSTFIPTPEASIKPQGDPQFVEVNANVLTLAQWVAATNQMLDDYTQLQALIDSELRLMLMLEEERQLLWGTGTSQFDGMMEASGTLSYLWSSGVVGDTRIDAIRKAMTLVWLNHIPPTGTIVHPTDKQHIDLTKADDGHYIFNTIIQSGGVNTLWNTPIVQTPVMTVTRFLVSNFQLAARLYDRETTSVRVGEPNDFFLKNMKAVLAELREAFALVRKTAIVQGTFDSAPTP